MKKKTLLITGVNGYIGQKIYSDLKNKLDVFGIGRNGKKKISKKKIILDNINLQNLKKLNCKPDLILHLAGGSSVLNSIKYPKKDYINTFQSGKKVIDFYLNSKKKFRFIFVSSAAVYGNSIGVVKPISVYGKNKLKLERYLEEKIKKTKNELIIIRLYSLYGEGLKKQLLWDACNKIENKNFYFYGSGKEIRSWVYVFDFIKILKKIFYKKFKSRIIKLDIAGLSVTNAQIIKIIFDQFKINKKPKFNNLQRKGDPKKLISTKKNKYNFKVPITSLESGISNYVKWFKKNK